MTDPRVKALMEAAKEVKADCIARADKNGVVPIGRGAWDQLTAALSAIASPSIATPRTDPRVVALVDALFFYGTHALGCRMVHREGDTHRQALHDDGGERARAAIAAIEERQTNE